MRKKVRALRSSFLACGVLLAVTAFGAVVSASERADEAQQQNGSVIVPAQITNDAMTTPAFPSVPAPELWEQKMEIASQSKAVALGDSIYFTSSVNGTAYLSSAAMPAYNLSALKVGVKAGNVLSREVVAGEPTSFSTAGLRNVSFPENYTFNITVYQTGTSRYTVSEVQVLDDSKRLTPQPVQIHYGDTPEYFSFDYNRMLRLAPGKSLNSIIELKLEGEQKFKAFDRNQGTVEVVGGRVYVYLEQAPLGRNFYLKLRTGSVMSSDGHRNKEVISGPLKSFIPIHLISHGAQTSATVKKGEEIEFSIDYPGTVYLSPSMLVGSKEDFDKTAAKGLAKKLEVSAGQAKQPLKISTRGLQAGRYMLHVWSGHSIIIEIVD